MTLFLLLFLILSRVLVGKGADNKVEVPVAGAECDRTCVGGDGARKTCKFEFRVELYNALSKACFDCPTNLTDCARPDCVTGDGVERVLVATNRFGGGGRKRQQMFLFSVQTDF